jgi:hypothetical protein
MEMKRNPEEPLQPAEYCRQALQAIEVSDERRKRRKRDTGPDVTGMDIKRELLQKAIEAEPAPGDFEGWLLEQVIASPAAGPIRAMAIEIHADYENARMFHSFNKWLADGAPTPRVEDPSRPRRRRPD